MTLIKCSECNNEVSDRAESCPKCGNPINPQKKVQQVVVKKQPKQYGFLHLILIFGLIFFIYSLWNGKGASTSSNRDMCRDNAHATTMIQNYVSTLLLSPSTAKFEYEIAKPIGGCSFSLESYVDSQNGFGAMLRKHYKATIKYNKETNKWNMTSFSFLD